MSHWCCLYNDAWHQRLLKLLFAQVVLFNIFLSEWITNRNTISIWTLYTLKQNSQLFALSFKHPGFIWKIFFPDCSLASVGSISIQTHSAQILLWKSACKFTKAYLSILFYKTYLYFAKHSFSQTYWSVPTFKHWFFKCTSIISLPKSVQFINIYLIALISPVHFSNNKYWILTFSHRKICQQFLVKS